MKIFATSPPQEIPVAKPIIAGKFCVKKTIIPIEDDPQSGDNEICVLAAA
jgi:hypothetical protein